MTSLGKTLEHLAIEFVSDHPTAKLGSKGMGGTRRVSTEATGDELEKQKLEFAEIAKLVEFHEISNRVDSKIKKIAASLGNKGIAFVIPCHNYARYLEECLQSLSASTIPPSQIIVVDDSSDDDPRSICNQIPGVKYVRCEVRDVYKARAIGLQYVDSKYVCFLDADDKITQNFIEESLEIFKSDLKVAITYPILQQFGAEAGPAHQTEKANQILTADDIEQRNWIPAGSVYRTELLHQSLAFKRGTIDPQKNWSQDWHVAKAVLRSGLWVARQMKEPLLYRKHDLNMSSRPNSAYWDDADFGNEMVTIVIAFSGRYKCWEKLRRWLWNQTWPKDKLRLLILNGTHKPLSIWNLKLEQWDSSIQIERFDVGAPGLADEERRNQPATGRAVEAAVAGLYNKAIQLLGTEYVVFIEDDVIPHSLDAIQLLLKEMGPWTAGVSGVYRQRYQVDRCCSFSLPYTNQESFKPLEGTGVETVDGSGFGCLLTRRSLLRRFPLVGDTENHFFDVDFSHNCKMADEGKWTWLLHRGVQADHLIAD